MEQISAIATPVRMVKKEVITQPLQECKPHMQANTQQEARTYKDIACQQAGAPCSAFKLIQQTNACVRLCCDSPDHHRGTARAQTE